MVYHRITIKVLVLFCFLEIYSFIEALPNLNSNSSEQVGNEKFHNNGVPIGFEKVLPENIIKELRDLHDNTKLSPFQKRAKFDDILNQVDGETLAKLPLPPGFDRLPKDVQNKIKQIHQNVKLTWNKKHARIGQLLDDLPEELRTQLLVRPASLRRSSEESDFPPLPPPGFEKVLPKDVYSKLLAIHQNDTLSTKQKISQIDKIMREQPYHILYNLPLPPRFDELPEEYIKKAKEIFANKNLDYDAKNKAVIDFIKSLPVELRKLVRPPLPPALDYLPTKDKEKIIELFEDKKLTDRQRHDKFWMFVDNLPKENKDNIRAEIPDLSSEGSVLNDSSSGDISKKANTRENINSRNNNLK